ncbi:MAG: hypothetical protein CVT90_00010 [Candidatus Altiarchaeales archaeon HGW-Altiarchaeales-3]|nr:MAG: hypothetical protein CVT90_00010 [Candidatus Altiarchaeales archaeon HGW-Altiarchaeales-3]
MSEIGIAFARDIFRYDLKIPDENHAGCASLTRIKILMKFIKYFKMDTLTHLSDMKIRKNDNKLENFDIDVGNRHRFRSRYFQVRSENSRRFTSHTSEAFNVAGAESNGESAYFRDAKIHLECELN